MAENLTFSPLFWHIPVDVRLGGGGRCREDFRPYEENRVKLVKVECETLHMHMTHLQIIRNIYAFPPCVIKG
jgi:hypothetical protein